MIDPLVSLALAMRSKPGLYVFLLGSGISSAAGIPTGWDVMIDLIQQIAAPKAGSISAEKAFDWYKDTYGEDPGYSQLLDRLTHSPEERQNILRRYFEPTEADRQQGKKVPTAAHRALARLMADGYVRIILTTNFDRLLEQAMSEIGVEPLVISSPDAIDGMIALPHVDKCVVKVNGDYLDCRMKNTPDELGQFDSRVEGLLSRVFEDFGLVICGWSGEWDIALRACLERTKNRRFTTYWTHRGAAPKGAAAQRLIQQRGAEPICIAHADSFMERLSESMSAITGALPRDPIDMERAIVLVKKYSTEERFRMDLHDLVIRESQWVRSQTKSGFDVKLPYSDEELIRRVNAYEGITAKLRTMVAIGCYWGINENASVWTKCMEILGESLLSSGHTIWLGLQRYPMLLALYAGGIGAAASRKFYAIRAMLRDALIEGGGHEIYPVSMKVHADNVLEKEAAMRLPGLESRYRPLNDHLSQVNEDLREHFALSQVKYDMAFDLFEYLLALTYVDIKDKQKPFRVWGPFGSFGWRWHRGNEWNVMRQTDDELEKQGVSWGPIAQGLLGGDLPRLIKLKRDYDDLIREGTSSWG